jgi:hypothetical protein
MTPANLHGDYNGMLSVWWMLVVEWVAMMLLAWYLEQVDAALCVWRTPYSIQTAACLLRAGQLLHAGTLKGLAPPAGLFCL